VAGGQTPSGRIVAEIRERIVSGKLGEGERVPSARQITQEWGVAIATATKVLAALRQEGLVRAVSGVGTVVASRHPAASAVQSASSVDHDPVAPARLPRRRETGGGGAGELTRERIAQVAVRIADSEGIAALSMRRVATELGLATMSLYRYVRGKDDLILLMFESIFADYPLREPAPAGWRFQLEQLSRLQWSACRAHPWLARVISFTRPQLAPNGMLHTEWGMRAVSQLGLDPAMMLYVVVALTGFVVGTAVNLESEAEARQDTGVTSDEWMDAQEPAFLDIMGSGRYPLLSAVAAQPDFTMDLDTLFEFGLQRMLDGLAVYFERRSDGSS
jgi:AcrR family transcriptional regulator